MGSARVTRIALRFPISASISRTLASVGHRTSAQTVLLADTQQQAGLTAERT